MTTAKDYVSQQGTGTLTRPRYSAGLLLEDDDLTAAVDYTRNMVRLLFRSLFGCGVICGLGVDAELTCNGSKLDVSIASGVALDCMGNPIEIPKGFTITYDPKCDPLPDKLWVVACYVEKCCQPRDISCAADDDGHLVATRIAEGYEVRLYDKRPKCVCSCEPPDQTPTPTDDCCDDDAPAAAAAPAKKVVARNEAEAEMYERCPCYADHFSGKCDCDCCCPCVLIAYVTLEQERDKAVDVDVSDKWVRRIRPLLIAEYRCLTAATHPMLEEMREPRRRRRSARAAEQT
jgi:hypothetical protein